MEVEGLKRHEEENPLNLTNMQLEERKEAVEKQLKKHPHLSPQWVEWLWNYLSRHTEDECADMVNNGKLISYPEEKDGCPTQPSKSVDEPST